MDWHETDLSTLYTHLRADLPPGEAEKTVFAFERALQVARVDGHLLEHLLVASVCLLSHAESRTPRDVLEEFFRRSPSDGRWRTRFASYLA